MFPGEFGLFRDIPFGRVDISTLHGVLRTVARHRCGIGLPRFFCSVCGSNASASSLRNSPHDCARADTVQLTHVLLLLVFVVACATCRISTAMVICRRLASCRIYLTSVVLSARRTLITIVCVQDLQTALFIGRSMTVQNRPDCLYSVRRDVIAKICDRSTAAA